MTNLLFCLLQHGLLVVFILLHLNKMYFFQEYTPSGVVEFELPMTEELHGQATLATQTGHR
jgi:hypothetical protein